MNYKEKLNCITIAIADSMQYRISDEPIALKRNFENGLAEIEIDDINKILEQLESQGEIRVLTQATQITEISRYDPYANNQDHYDIKILTPEFFTSLYEDNVTKPEEQHEPGTDNTHTCFIEYTEDRRVLLDGVIELAKPNFAGENDTVFRFLYDNPNKTFTKIENEKRTNLKLKKSFDQILSNLNFKNGLRKHFFEVSKTGILFKNCPPKNNK